MSTADKDERGVETVHARTSKHHEITVETHDGLIELRFSGRSQGWTDEQTRVSESPVVLDYLQIPLVLKPDACRVLVIGLGGGVLPRRLLAAYPELLIDVVEIDPEVVAVCGSYFGIPDDARLRIIVADGREYLQSSDALYDAVMIDAFCVSPTAGCAVPFVFVTREFFELVHSRLTPGGAISVNVVGMLEGSESEPLRRFCRGVADEFPSWQLLIVSASKSKAPGRRNFVVVGCDQAVSREMFLSALRDADRADGITPAFSAMAEDVLPSPFDARVLDPYTDSDAPEDGLMRG